MQPTPKQTAVLDSLRERIAGQGVPPALQEIADAFGIHVNAVVKHLKALDSKGYIELILDPDPTENFAIDGLFCGLVRPGA